MGANKKDYFAKKENNYRKHKLYDTMLTRLVRQCCRMSTAEA